MAVNLSPLGGVGAQFFDNSGAPLTGGKIYTYLAGTTTASATYTSSLGITAHSNPIILDAAGRVPSGGEIWLTDGINYKFVLKTSADVLIATYDNISGINSNFVNYTGQQEIQSATAGQTVFTLTTMQYQPGTNSLSVFVDGVNQYGPGAQYAYVETDSTTVTFVSGLHVGASVKFTTVEITNGSVGDASQVTYDPPFTGSVTTNVEAKLAQTVSVLDFGAVGDGVTDDTAAIQAALDFAAVNGAAVFLPSGTYKITSALNVTSKKVSIFGAGADASIIEALSCNGINITTPSNDNSAQFFEDFALVGAPGSTANWAAIESILPSGGTPGVDSRDGLHFNRLRLYDWNQGFIISNTWEWSVQLCKIQKVRNPIALGEYAYVGRIINNFMVFANGDSHGGSADAYAIDFIGSTVEGIIIQNNQMNGFARGLNARTSCNAVYVTYTNNDTSTTEYGVYNGLLNNQFVCSANYFELKENNSVGVFISPNNSEVNCNNIIHSNVFIRSTGNNTIGIKVGTTGTDYAWRNDIEFNHFIDLNGYDITLDGGPGKTNISNNRCSSTATTASIRIDSITGAPITLNQNWCAKGIQILDSSNLTDGKILLNQNTENDTYQAWRQTAAPTTGTWRLGDIVWNSDPDSTEYVGWVCTVAGTPGTWNGFGVIA